MVATGRCEIHRAMIYDRGGTRRFGEVRRMSQVAWSRDRDGVSEGTITIQGEAACGEQRDFISQIAEKRHELVIYRGDDRVWEGPIFRIGDEGDRITIFAKDVTAYLYGTMLSKPWDNRYASARGIVPVTTRFEEIINYELVTSRTGRTVGGAVVPFPAWESLNPAANILPHLQVHHFVNEAETAAYTQAFETNIGRHLENAARTSGIDFTAVGRAIHLWDTSRAIGRIRTLTEADFFGNIIVTGYGADHSQAAYVMGQDGLYGEAINPEYLDFYGPWTTSFTAYNEEGTEAPTVGALNSQAARNVSGRSPVPVEVRVPDNSSIRLSETLRISDLVPGVQMPLRATLNARARNQVQKLDHLNVLETSKGEEIKVTLSPANSPDSDEEEED